MNEQEKGFLETILDNFTPRIARGMQEGLGEDRVIEDRERLTVVGRSWVQGYLTARLSVLRANTTGNPNLSADDFEAVEELVQRYEAEIAAELYA